MTAERRLQAIVRCVYLLRGELERNGDRYDGRMVPNLTSITDLATLEGKFLTDVEASLNALELERGKQS